MAVIRAFIAIDLSAEIQVRLDQVTEQLKSRLHNVPVRWVPAKNMHLTLKFLGDVSESNLDVLKKILRVETEKQPSFEFSVGVLGAFPSIHRPRVIWVGIEAPPELNALQQGIDEETSRLGYPREERPFSPHLTLGRVYRNADSGDVRQISEVLGSAKVGFLGATRARAVHLYRSDLRPEGAIYRQLFSAPLGESKKLSDHSE